MTQDTPNNTPEGSKEQSTHPATPINENVLKVVPGALDNALIRTFKGDITEQMGPTSLPIAETFVPPAPVVPPPNTPAQSSTPEQAHAPSPISSNVKEHSVVRTFKGDVQDLIRNKKMSITKMAALQSDETIDTTKIDSTPRAWRRLLKILFVFFLVVLLGVIASGAYYVYKLNTTTTFVPTFAPSLLFTERNITIDTTRKSGADILSYLDTVRTSNAFNLGIVIDLYLTQASQKTTSTKGILPLPEHLTAREFLTRIQAHVPNTFLNALSSKYMVGIYTMSNGNVPFIVLKTNSYGYAFSGMLAWEKNMLTDLSPFFPQNVQKSALSAIPTFSDTVIQNMDVRELRTSTGAPLILYSFINQSTVIITTDPRVLVEVANRIRTKR